MSVEELTFHLEPMPSVEQPPLTRQSVVRIHRCAGSAEEIETTELRDNEVSTGQPELVVPDDSQLGWEYHGRTPDGTNIWQQTIFIPGYHE